MTRDQRWVCGALVLAVAAGASLMANALIARAFFAYRDQHPPGAPLVLGKCNAPALVAHWTFDEISGGLASDASPFANNGRLEVDRRPWARLRYGLPESVAGVRGKALHLNGHQWVAAGNNDCFTSEQFTFAGWIWLDENGNVPTIVSKAAWTENGWWLLTTTKGAQEDDRYLDLGVSWGSGRTHIKSGYQLPLREWHHVVLTVDNARGEVQFFIDGKPSGPRHTNVPKWLVNWDHDLVLGDFDGSTRWPWVGKLDDLRFYNYALPEAEAAALYSPRPASN